MRCRPVVKELLDVATGRGIWLAADIESMRSKANGTSATVAAFHDVGLKADHHLVNCLQTAGVQEDQLALPLSIAELTSPQDAGVGSVLPLSRAAAAAFDQCSASYMTWFRERYSYYSGVQYAEDRLCDGTRQGFVVGLVIGGINLSVLVCVAYWLLRCFIRRKPCYMCFMAFAPRMAVFLERCGCGPGGARKQVWQDMVTPPAENPTLGDQQL